MPGAELGDPKAQRCTGDHSQNVTLLCGLSVVASIPVPGSLWEWQECQGDVNGDIRSHSHQPDDSTGQEGLSAMGRGAEQPLFGGL